MRRLARSAGIVLLAGLATPAARAGVDLDRLVERARTQAARRLARLGIDAAEQGQQASAVRLLERALALDPGQIVARARLGWRKRGGDWERDRDVAQELAAAADTDYALVASIRAETAEIDARLVTEMLRLCDRYADEATARALLAPLLSIAPRDERLHRALGHEQVAGRWTRPELAAVARTMDGREAAWRACAAPAGPVLLSTRTAELPGAGSARAMFACAGRHVDSSWGAEATMALAARMEGPHALLRLVLGDDTARWDPPLVHVLNDAEYRRLVEALLDDPDERARRLRHDTWRDGDRFRIRGAPDGALDLYGHCAGFWTLQRHVAPAARDDPEGRRRDWSEYAWIKEGAGYFVTLELWDTATSWFSSAAESSGKITTGTPRPDPLTRASALGWVRGEVRAGAAPPLRAVLGSSLNNLDRFESLMAWTLVRFLLLLDEAAFGRALPLLRARNAGPSADRAQEALAEAYGRPWDELERLWRAWLLELS